MGSKALTKGIVGRSGAFSHYAGFKVRCLGPQGLGVECLWLGISQDVGRLPWGRVAVYVFVSSTFFTGEK